ncbi:hypothetical protein DJ68_17310 [Halorubrum sp. C3]|nr:hypothetical protein DJ68_17310 [Halorubrum sp. C3]
MTDLPVADRIASIEIEGDPDGTGRRTARFEMFTGGEEGLQISPEQRTQIRATPGQSLLALVDGTIGDFVDAPINKDLFINLGGSQFAVTIDFNSWEGATGPNGNPLQWGDKGDPDTFTKSDATGEHPTRQMACLFWWLRNTRVSSVSGELFPGAGIVGDGPATLRYGQYREGGVYEPLQVVFENPGADFPGQSMSTWDGSITCIEAIDAGDPIDAVARDTR